MTGSPSSTSASSSVFYPLLSASTNLFVAAAGAGILSLPYAARMQGIGTALIWCVVVAALNGYCNLIVAQTVYLLRNHLKTATYDETVLRGASLHPSKGNLRLWFYVGCSILVGSVGTAIGFLVIVGNLGTAAISDWCGDSTSQACSVFSSRTFVTLAFAIIAVPLSTTAKMHNLLIGSLIAAVSIILVGALVITRGAQRIADHATGQLTFFNSNLSQVLLGIPISTFAFGNSIQVAAVMAESAKPVQRRFHWAVGMSTVLCYFLYLSTACMGYASFGLNTQGDILNSFPQGDAFADVAKLAMAVHVGMVLPVIILPAKRCAELMGVAMRVLADYQENLYRREGDAGSNSASSASASASHGSSFFLSRCLAFLSYCWSVVTGFCYSSARICFGTARANRCSAMVSAFAFAGCGCCPCYKARLRKSTNSSSSRSTEEGKRRKRHRADLARPSSAAPVGGPFSSVHAAATHGGAEAGEGAVGAGAGLLAADERTGLLMAREGSSVSLPPPPPPGIIPSSSSSVPSFTSPASRAEGDAEEQDEREREEDDDDSDSDEEEDLLEGPALDLQELNQRLDEQERDPNKTFCGIRVRPYFALLLWNGFYLAGCATAAILFPKVQVIFGLMGSTISVLQIFIAPAMMLLFTAWRTEEAKRRYPHLFMGSRTNSSSPVTRAPSFRHEYQAHHRTDSALSLIRVQRDEPTPPSSATHFGLGRSQSGLGGPSSSGSSFYVAMPGTEGESRTSAAAPSRPSKQASSSKLEPLMLSSPVSERAEATPTAREEGDDDDDDKTRLMKARQKSSSSLRISTSSAIHQHQHHVPSMATTTAPTPSLSLPQQGNAYRRQRRDNGNEEDSSSGLFSEAAPWYTPRSVFAMKAHAYVLLGIAAVLCIIGTTINIREIVNGGNSD